MADHLITEILKIEAEADRIIHDAKQKAEKIIASIHYEIELVKTALEGEYQRNLEKLPSKIAGLRKPEEEHLRNEFELSKKKLLAVDDAILEDAVHCVLRHIYTDISIV